MILNQQWNIQKRSKHCQNCDQIFEDEMVLHCFLRIEGAIPIRHDFCDSCWERFQEERKEEENSFSYWQTRFKIPKVEVKPEPIKRDRVESLLKKYISSDSPEHQNLCYILAVMLERKKLFSQKDSIEESDGKKFLIYEQTKSGETFMIVDPQLKLTQIPEVQKQVITLLDEEIEG